MKNQSVHRTIYPILLKMAATAGVLALFVLIASLPNLDFQPGKALAPQENVRIFSPINRNFDGTLLASICLSTMLLMVPAGIVLLIFSSEARTIFKKNAKVLLLWVLILLFLRFYLNLAGDESNINESPSASLSTPEALNPPFSIGVDTEGIVDYVSPQLTGLQGYLIGFLLILLSGFVAYFFLEKNRSRKDDLEKITLRALREISSGRQWEDAVIDCYAQMNAIVSYQRKLDRELAMTPSEFSKLLVSSGLPLEPVVELTQLFEQARYGTRASHSGEAQRALQCLTAINLVLGGEN